jgi:hypothetical protein
MATVDPIAFVNECSTCQLADLLRSRANDYSRNAENSILNVDHRGYTVALMKRAAEEIRFLDNLVEASHGA